jgi:hypothetical protein
MLGGAGACIALTVVSWGKPVAKPPFATADQSFLIGHARVIGIVLPAQSDCDGVPFRVCRIAFAQVVGTDRYCDLFALIYVDYGQSFDFSHCFRRCKNKKWGRQQGLTARVQPLGNRGAFGDKRPTARY